MLKIGGDFMFKKLVILGLAIVVIGILGTEIISASTNSNTNVNSGGTTPYTPSTTIKNWHESN